jgi:GWxTD domain-containing protein
MKPIAVLGLSFLLCVLLLDSCAVRQPGKGLDPESEKFLSEVRYLITKGEREAFLKLPLEERDQFIKEFWKKRDLDPETEENKFKDEYYQRIKEANRLFTEGGTAGWLQDRGRVYILIGAPDQREAYPRGRSFYDVPTEIWYYGFFRIVFIDSHWSGNYRLDPQSAQHLAEINLGQMRFRPRISKEKQESSGGVFELNLEIEKTQKERPTLLVKVPYKNIVLTAEGEKLKTTLELSLAAFDVSQKKVWEYENQYPISLDEGELEELFGQEFVIEIPVPLEKGEYKLVLEVRNAADGSRGQGKTSFSKGGME